MLYHSFILASWLDLLVKPILAYTSSTITETYTLSSNDLNGSNIPWKMMSYSSSGSLGENHVLSFGSALTTEMRSAIFSVFFPRWEPYTCISQIIMSNSGSVLPSAPCLASIRSTSTMREPSSNLSPFRAFALTITLSPALNGVLPVRSTMTLDLSPMTMWSVSSTRLLAICIDRVISGSTLTMTATYSLLSAECWLYPLSLVMMPFVLGMTMPDFRTFMLCVL